MPLRLHYSVPQDAADVAARNGRFGRRGAFTLVELLVVIGIIALLISILLPALNRAMTVSRMLSCENKLRTLGQAMWMHAGEHKQYFPTIGPTFAGKPGAYVVASPANLADPYMQKYDYYKTDAAGDLRPTALPLALAPYLNIPVNADATQAVGPQQALLTGTLQDIVSCPADQRILAGDTFEYATWTYDKGVNGTTLYGFSSYVGNIEALGWGNNGNQTAHSRERGFVPSMANPSQTMLMCDGLPYNPGPPSPPMFMMYANFAPATLADVWNGTNNACGGQWDFPLYRHNGRINVLFIDGHCEGAYILNIPGTNGGVTNGPGITASGDLANIYIDKDFR